ncbi:unnamed protein product [Closterium sp. NIES-64]|nr:unnamed protein product [Closterium sp. NIES-64]
MPVPRNRSGGFTPKSGNASAPSLFKSSSASSVTSLSARLSWNDLAPALAIALLLVAGMLLAVTYMRASSMRCSAMQLEQHVRALKQGGSRQGRQSLVERQNDIGKRTAETLKEALHLVPGSQPTAAQGKKLPFASSTAAAAATSATDGFAVLN